MIKVLFFAYVREKIGRSSIELTQRQAMTADSVRQQLSRTDQKWAAALNQDELLVAVNQKLCEWSHPIQDGDEVAFFPPITGG